MKYTPSGGLTSPGPTTTFTGTVQVDNIRTPDEQSAIGSAHVRFSAGARTAWHHHPKWASPSPTASDWSADEAASHRRSDPATSSTSNPAKNTGREQARLPKAPTDPGEPRRRRH